MASRHSKKSSIRPSVCRFLHSRPTSQPGWRKEFCTSCGMSLRRKLLRSISYVGFYLDPCPRPWCADWDVSPMLEDGIRSRSKHTYLCKRKVVLPKMLAEDVVVKVIASRSYPTQLHQELARAGMMPPLFKPPKVYPGGFTVLQMVHLSPDEGWIRLDSVPGPDLAVAKACEAALARLQSCLGGTAVHGNLRPPNIFIR